MQIRTKGARLDPRKAQYGKVFLLGLMTALLFILPWMLKDGYLCYAFDWVEQQVTFNQRCNWAVKSGNIWWDPTLDLGTGFLNGYSFYGIGSPFFWLSLLFPAEKTFVTIGLMLAFKLAVAATAAYAWIRQRAQTEEYAAIGGLLYAFSGVQIASLIFHFADYLALFPFLLLALDQTAQNPGKTPRGVFALVAAVLICTNSVFFFGTVVFLVLYFICMLVCGEYKLRANGTLILPRLVVESALGVGLTGLLLVPTILFISQNPRAAESFTSLRQMLVYLPYQYVDILRGMLFPAETIEARAFLANGINNLPELYLPVFGLILAAAWCFQYKKSWISRLLMVCAVFAMVPVLNSLFMAGAAEYYARWFYMPLLLLSLATVKALEEKSLSLKPGFVLYGGLFLLFLGVWVAWGLILGERLARNVLLAVVFVLVSLFGAAVCLIVRKIQAKKAGVAILTALVMLVSAGTGFINTYYQQRYWPEKAGLDPKQLFYSRELLPLEENDGSWRVDTAHSFLNLGTYLFVPTMTDFSSTVSGSIFDFYEGLGIGRTIRSYPSWSNDGLRALLSVKYLVLSESQPSYQGPMPGSVLLQSQNGFEIFQNENFIPMGYTFEESMSEQQLQALGTPEAKSRAMVRALLLTEEQQQTYGHLLTPAAADALVLDDAAFANQCAQRAQSACESFAYTKDGFAATAELSKENLLFFSVPYDAGWKAVVDGAPAKIERVDFGLMAVLVPEGRHTVEFIYRPQGFTVGAALSGVSAAGLLLYAFVFKKRGAKTEDKSMRVS